MRVELSENGSGAGEPQKDRCEYGSYSRQLLTLLNYCYFLKKILPHCEGKTLSAKWLTNGFKTM